MTEAMWADEDVRLLREPYSQLFFDEFKKGLILYIRGEWPAALESLKKAAKIAPGHYDGPSEDLIKYMEVSNGIAPREW